MPLTSNSFSAVGLFFGFLVNATLTKLWKVGLLKKKNKKPEKMLVSNMYMWKTSHVMAIQRHRSENSCIQINYKFE